MPNYVAVAQTGELKPGSMRCVEASGHKLVLVNLEGQFFAVADECTHEGAPLSEGFLEGDELHCPWHDACFNVRSGAVTAPPAEDGLRRYNVRVSGDKVEVEI